MRKAAFLLIVFSGFFLTSAIISPIYISFILAAILLITNLLHGMCMGNRIPAIKTVLIAITFLVYILLTQTLILEDANHAVYNVIFSLLYFVFTYYAIYNLYDFDIIKLSKIMINVSIPLLLIEAVYRWMHPIEREINISQGTAYYGYKYSSIMYEDSNFVGIFLVALFFFCSYLRRNYKLNLKKQQAMLFVLTILTLSKASIAVIFVFWILFDLQIKKWKKLLLIIASGFTVGIYWFRQIIFDNSLSGKLHIFYLTKQWWSEDTSVVDRIIGTGFGESVNQIGMGAHNLIIAYLIESGIIGTLLLLFFWIRIIKASRGKAIIIMLPFFVNAMSVCSTAIPYFYCMLAIICVLENNRTGINQQADFTYT